MIETIFVIPHLRYSTLMNKKLEAAHTAQELRFNGKIIIIISYLVSL